LKVGGGEEKGTTRGLPLVFFKAGSSNKVVRTVPDEEGVSWPGLGGSKLTTGPILSWEMGGGTVVLRGRALKL